MATIQEESDMTKNMKISQLLLVGLVIISALAGCVNKDGAVTTVTTPSLTINEPSPSINTPSPTINVSTPPVESQSLTMTPATVAPSASVMPALEMTQAHQDILATMCLVIPPFTDLATTTDDFMRSFLFGAYTSGGFKGWSDDGVTYEQDKFWISADTAESLIFTVFGYEYDVSRLTRSENTDYCYYEGSSIVVSPSDFGDVRYEYSELVQENDRYAAVFHMKSGGEEDVLAIHIMYLLPADNDIGFTVCCVSHDVIDAN